MTQELRPSKGVLLVGTNGKGEVCIDHADIETDSEGIGHLIFSPDQAKSLAKLLNVKAADAVLEVLEKK